MKQPFCLYFVPCQLMRNVLYAYFLIMQVLCYNDYGTASQFVTYSHYRANFFLSDLLIFPYESINLSNNRSNGTITLSWMSIIFHWHMSLTESLVLFQYIWTWHAVFITNRKYETMYFSTSYSFCSQKLHYTSLSLLAS